MSLFPFELRHGALYPQLQQLCSQHHINAGAFLIQIGVAFGALVASSSDGDGEDHTADHMWRKLCELTASCGGSGMLKKTDAEKEWHNRFVEVRWCDASPDEGVQVEIKGTSLSLKEQHK